MEVIQCYLQGAKHKTQNQPCEDRTYTLTKNDVTAIALADGAGSHKYTHAADGAECVTKTVCKFFCNNFDKFYETDDLSQLSAVLITVCRRALEEKKKDINVDDIARLSSTMLAVAVKNHRYIACHIGDGVIGKLTSSGTAVISPPENGEFAGTTYFVTSSEADRHLHLYKGNTADDISYFLMSDGMQTYVYDEQSNCFYDAVRKMALLLFKKNGQGKLTETMMKYMVEADPMSDDCSFIALLIQNEKADFESDPEPLEAKENKPHHLQYLMQNSEKSQGQLSVKDTKVHNDKQVKNKTGWKEKLKLFFSKEKIVLFLRRFLR